VQLEHGNTAAIRSLLNEERGYARLLGATVALHKQAPIIIAAEKGYLDILKMLVEQKAVKTPQQFGTGRSITLLLVRQDVNQVGRRDGVKHGGYKMTNGHRPMHKACQHGHLEVTL